MPAKHRPIAAAAALAVALAGCGKAQSEAAAPAPSPAPTAQAPAAASDGIVIRAAPGGKNPGAFCMPQWSIANETRQDVGALLIQLEWRTQAGEVLEPVGAMGTLVEPFTAGKRKDMSLNGYTAACTSLQLVARTYACRDVNAVRVPCPGPLRAQAEGGVQIDITAAAEGSMKGAVEAR
jgi:hypothetical protein